MTGVYGIMPYTPVTNTADYNATDKPAAPGVTVTPAFSGDLSALPSKVEWRDSKGTVLKTCELDQSKGIKAQVAACTFDIPETAKTGDYFNVVLVSGGNDVSAWTVLVTKESDEYEPAYEGKLVVPGQETKSAPSFTGKDGKGVDVPEGSKFSIGDYKAPEGYVVTIDENTGEITVTFPDGSKLNKDTVEKFDVPVVVTYPDGTTDNVTVTVTVGEPDTKTPDWKDGSGEPGGKVVIPNDGGPVEDGTTVDTDGPGKAKIDGDGNLVVDIDDNAKPGDKIVVIVKDKNGNEIDRVTVTVEKPAAGDMTTEPGVKKFKLVRTGAQVGGLVGIAAVMGVAGLGLALVRRRREGEEN